MVVDVAVHAGHLGEEAVHRTRGVAQGPTGRSSSEAGKLGLACRELLADPHSHPPPPRLEAAKQMAMGGSEAGSRLSAGWLAGWGNLGLKRCLGHGMLHLEVLQQSQVLEEVGKEADEGQVVVAGWVGGDGTPGLAGKCPQPDNQGTDVSPQTIFFPGQEYRFWKTSLPPHANLGWKDMKYPAIDWHGQVEGRRNVTGEWAPVQGLVLVPNVGVESEPLAILKELGWDLQCRTPKKNVGANRPGKVSF